MQHVRERTRALIASARAAGNKRLVEMNEPVEFNWSA
jgi:hypothetical protein